jgi:hypothetical protein
VLRLIRFIFTWGIIVGLVWVILQLDFQGKPVKERVSEFIKAPLIQEVVRQAKGVAVGLLTKDLKDEPAMEKVKNEERALLEKVLEEEAKSK